MRRKNIEPEPEVNNSPQMVVGLDIGTTKIAMVMGYLCEDGKVDVCSYSKTASIGVEFGLIRNLQDTINSINEVKQDVEQATGQTVKDVYVGVAGRHIKSVTCTHSITRFNGHDEIIRKEEIAKMTSDMESYIVDSGTIIAVIPQSYNIDGEETLRPVGRVGQNITGTYQIITGNEFEIRKIIKSVRDSDLSMSKLLLEPMASAISCLTEEEKKNGVALIDIGGGTTDLIIYKSSVPVYIRVIPVGGQVVTKDIMAMGLTYEEAEQIKVEHGSCAPEEADANHFITLKNSIYYGQNVKINERDLAKVINARVKRDILEAVKFEIERSGYMNDVKRVVITGGGARLKNIKSLSEFVIQKLTRIGTPGVGFTQTLEPKLKDPIFSTALGLLAYGCKSVAQPYNTSAEPANHSDSSSEDNEGQAGKPGIMSWAMAGLNKVGSLIWDSMQDDGKGVD